MAVIGGARSVNGIMGGVKAGYMKVLKVTWAVSPTTMFIAQKYVPLPYHVVFFNAVSFSIGTTFAVILKKARMKAVRDAQKKEKAKAESEKQL